MNRYTIGREKINDIAISDKSVSRQHAEFCELGDDTCKLVDSGSSNGIWRLGDSGGKPVLSAEPDAEAMVKFGDYPTTISALLIETKAAVSCRPSDGPLSVLT